jgi:preprotein translocase subunit SecB
MKENFKIIAQFIKDMSSETPDVQSYMFVKENISKYLLNININSKPLENKLIEVNTILKFEDKEPNEKKSHFEITYATVIRIEDKINKKNLEKIILCDVQNKIYPNIEKALLNLISDSGFQGIKFDKKVDFNKLYNERFN